MDDDWHRCFIALSPDAATRDALASMPIGGARVRRVPIDQLHMTVAFLGSIPPEKGVLLGAALESVVVPLPELSFGDVEHWPSASHPRLIVVPFAECDGLSALESRVRTLVAGLGLPIDDHRPFKPHVTLARLPRGGRAGGGTRSMRGAGLHEGQVDGHQTAGATPGAPSFMPRFDTLTLFSSTLARHGARYRPLASAHVPAR
jgi:RNA 2',3'-cyclic 3'-phosphodiesterase